MSLNATVTTAQRHAWSHGDLGKLSARLPTIYAEVLCEALDLRPGERVLDVAAGTGTTSIAAARRFCEVTATDFVPRVLDHAAERATSEGLALAVRVADAQGLPFGDGEFDVVVSTFGAMFAPDHQRVADELLRVVRPGGRIGITAWSPEGVIAAFARAVGRHVPPPAGIRSPFEWGTTERITELFGARARSVHTTRRSLPFRFPSVEFAVAYLGDTYGPAYTTLARLTPTDSDILRADMATVWRAANRANDGTLVADAEYLENIIIAAD